MTFHPTIDLGNLLNIAAFVFTLWTFHKSNVKRINNIDFKVSLMWKSFAHRFNLPENLDENDIFSDSKRD